ncbi:hypothetical protein [Rhodoferax fermentans]|uniref:Lysis protein n=1 Tax=Rhodoferax fermentans TaxID=28066 RepID=A0A1T1ANQ7_RHOFE|nr:hypothetical protein [Rhodoferax fermentans]OOV05756.1 hypothetical protein RF819_02690 [Rhodoferax fermentans]
MRALLNPRLWIGLVIAAALSYGLYWWHHDGYLGGKSEVQALWDADKAQVVMQSLEKRRQVSHESGVLQTQADAILKDKDEKIRLLNSAVSAVLASLRNRPARPNESGTGLPTDASTGTSASCTGAQLYRPDAEFLIGESARADKLRLDLGQCQAQYNEYREAVNQHDAAQN